jgi:WD domain, G-beta repeat
VQKLEGHSNGVDTVAFSPNGALLTSGSDDWAIRLWDTQTGQTIKILKYILTPEAIFSINNNIALVTDKGIFNAGDGSSLSADGIETCEDKMISVSGHWIQRGNRDLLWLPHEYRGIAASNGDMLAVGARSGLVSIFHFESSKSKLSWN